MEDFTNEKIEFLTLTSEKIDREIKFRETYIENLKTLSEQAQKEFKIIECVKANKLLPPEVIHEKVSKEVKKFL